jgi:NAD-dependent dihydropyrimidine dehydrogenase PreA subunit
MTYVITERCIDVKDASCVEVCPVDCIHASEDDRIFYIDPDECIDCGACVDPCPVDAIYAEEDVPPDQQPYIEVNLLYFHDPAAARRRVAQLRPPATAGVGAGHPAAAEAAGSPAIMPEA